MKAGTSCPEDQYQVEKILKQKTNSKSNLVDYPEEIFYFVKWLNYPSEQNSWQPKENLNNSLQRIEQFDNNPNKIIRTTKKSFNSNNQVIVTKTEFRPQKQLKYIVISDDQAKELLQANPSPIPQPYNIKDIITNPFEQDNIVSSQKPKQKLIDQAVPIPIPLQKVCQKKAKAKRYENHNKPKIQILKPAQYNGIQYIKYSLNGRKYISKYDVIKRYMPLQLLQFYEKYFNFYRKPQAKEQKKRYP